LRGEQRPAKRVGLDRDHHDILAVPERRQRMLDRGRRIAGRLDDDVDPRVRNQRLPVFRNVGFASPLLQRQRISLRNLLSSNQLFSNSQRH